MEPGASTERTRNGDRCVVGGVCEAGLVACFHPLTGRRQVDGTLKVLKEKYLDRYLPSPLIQVACGQCIGCRQERARQWAVRCMHEAQTVESEGWKQNPPVLRSSCFITLTYNKKHLPADCGLDVEHWQKFAKRLRHTIGPFRFLHCGEYGEDSYRPHYHAILFGEDFSWDRKPLKMSGQYQLYESPTLTKCWGKGFANIGDFSFDTANYVAGYVLKKQTGPHAEGYYERFDIITGEVYEIRAPYNTMSRNPGLGSKWFKKFKTDVYPSDEVRINGRKTRPPSYYDNLLDREDPKALELIKLTRQSKAKKYAHNNTYERLRVREACRKQKLNKFTRDNF